MDLKRAVELLIPEPKLRIPRTLPREMTPQQTAEYVLRLAPEYWFGADPDWWRERWLQGERYVLVDVPVDLLRVHGIPEDPRVDHFIRHADERAIPIVVTRNSRQVPTSEGVLPFMIADGRHRLLAHRQVGDQTVPAYLDDSLLFAFGLAGDYNAS